MKKTIKNIVKITIIIIVLTLIIFLAQLAWSKYITQIDGEATVQIAQMKFKINDNYYQNSTNIEFSSYRDDSNLKVGKGMLAPGTYGHIPIIIDATETQTSLEYEIEIKLKDKPTNLKFYYDRNKTKEIYVRNSKIVIERFILLEESDKIRQENIYWDWPIETGDTQEEIKQNDKEDSKFMNTIMKMDIEVSGKQVDSASLLVY